MEREWGRRERLTHQMCKLYQSVSCDRRLELVCALDSKPAMLQRQLPASSRSARTPQGSKRVPAPCNPFAHLHKLHGPLHVSLPLVAPLQQKPVRDRAGRRTSRTWIMGSSSCEYFSRAKRTGAVVSPSLRSLPGV
eukprot:273439-Hanusia_phi.AAC.2